MQYLNEVWIQSPLTIRIPSLTVWLMMHPFPRPEWPRFRTLAVRTKNPNTKMSYTIEYATLTRTQTAARDHLINAYSSCIYLLFACFARFPWKPQQCVKCANECPEVMSPRHSPLCISLLTQASSSRMHSSLEFSKTSEIIASPSTLLYQIPPKEILLQLVQGQTLIWLD
jgi:hypothetical protein